MTGLESSLVTVSCLTILLNTDAVRPHARRTAAMAICFSVAYAGPVIVVRAVGDGRWAGVQTTEVRSERVRGW